jgi:hypothetical protein
MKHRKLAIGALALAVTAPAGARRSVHLNGRPLWLAIRVGVILIGVVKLRVADGQVERACFSAAQSLLERPGMADDA